MAQLDPLIGALVKHGAEALVLQYGEKPSLVLSGARRPIVATPLTGQQVARLLAEISPADQRGAAATGQPVRFTYLTDGVVVEVDSDGTREATIRIFEPEADAVPVRETVPSPESPPAAGPVSSPGGPVSAGAPSAKPAAAGIAHLEELFHAMVQAGASDLHLSSGSPPQLRIDGDMGPMEHLPALDAAQVEALLRPITPEKNWDEFDRDNDTDFAHELTGVCRLRCNLFRDRKGPGGVFRVIPSEILTADDLGLSREIRNLCYLSKGLVLLTGPTGSGKSTTLTALIDYINKRRTDHVITIEDPIEFVHDNHQCLINQREVGLHTASFKRALRAALREDPDIVLVGELRDLETIAIALETAETGHLVFGTLHTSSAVSTIDRLIDQFPADEQGQIRVMLADSLKAVIAQVLCKKKGGGRIAALEVLMGVPAVSNLIREGKTFQIPSIMQTGKKHGMVSLNDSLMELVKKGTIEAEEAYTKAQDKLNLLSAFQALKIPTEFLGSERDAKTPEE
jgi:twitching motility protein PilT